MKHCYLYCILFFIFDAPIMTQPITHYRKDYQQPDFWINQVDLTFELDEDNTLVHSILSITRRVDAPKNAPLILNGEAIQLKNISLNNK